MWFFYFEKYNKERLRLQRKVLKFLSRDMFENNAYIPTVVTFNNNNVSPPHFYKPKNPLCRFFQTILLENS